MHDHLVDRYLNNQEKEIVRFIGRVQKPLMFKLFMLLFLPMAFLARIRVDVLNRTASEVSVPYSFINKNPFRSTYFAVLSMAAEMSTGLLAMMYVRNAIPSVSMLVTGLEASFIKKATGRVSFRCHDGLLLKDTVIRCISTDQPQVCRCCSTGYDGSGNEVARFYITWSFRAR